MEENPVLLVKGLKKYFFKPVLVKAVDGIDFSVKKGEIMGILGPNGAGKTTTIQMLLDVLKPTSGEIFYFGKKFSGNETEIKKRINFTSAYSHLPGRLTVWENLDVYARIYQVAGRAAQIEKLLRAFDVWQFKNKKVVELSAGQNTRVLLAKAFLNWPEIILLDEPTASLDPEIASRVREFLCYQQEKYQVTILLTSHNMKEVEELCDRIIFLNKGRILACDTPMGLVRRSKTAQVVMIVNKTKEKAQKYLKENNYPFTWKNNKVIIKVQEEQIPKIFYQLSDSGVFYSSIEILRPTLEDFFLQIVKENYEQSKD